jgi:hypothetical protein
MVEGTFTVPSQQRTLRPITFIDNVPPYIKNKSEASDETITSLRE